MNKKPLRIKMVLIYIAFTIVVSVGGLYYYWAKYYEDRVYPGVFVGLIDLGGTTKSQATGIIQARADRLLLSDLNFEYRDEVSSISITPPSLDSASSYPLIIFEVDEMVTSAFGEERDRTFIKYLTKHLLDNKKRVVKPTYTLQEGHLTEQLVLLYSDFIDEPQNAYLSAAPENSQSQPFISHPEKVGRALDFNNIIGQIKRNLDALENHRIVVSFVDVEPEVRVGDLKILEESALKIINSKPLVLRVENDQEIKIDGQKTWTIPNSRLVSWLKLDNNAGHAAASLNQKMVKEFLVKSVVPVIDQEASLPRFEIKNEKVVSWQAGREGYKLDVEASASAISEAFERMESGALLKIARIEPQSLGDNPEFQIKEIIGTGHSSFSGSPKNRRHNINIGASSLHGLLIKPDEEFSLLKALGEIDGSNGYLTELVIKGDKTVPEYGGGLCQVGTTVFRGALDSGLPITERRNHSYRVSYYEPAGTDATIYDPAPDFKFVNDTGNYILIQSRVEGDDLYFDFWGVNDGRIASTTDPVIYNIVKPPPTKIIETDSLAPGEKKCTESAHSGADAYFDYTVIYPENSTTTPIKTRRFSSHYIPWQAVCLVGKAATSTAATIEESVNPTTPDTGNATNTEEFVQ